MWAWVKTLMPGKRLACLDITYGHDGPYLGIHIKKVSGVPVLFCLILVRTLTGASVHHDVRRDGVKRYDRQMTPTHGASDEQGHDKEPSLLTSTGSAGPA